MNVPSTTEAYETVTTNIGYLKKSDDFDLLYMQVLDVTATYSGSGEVMDIECGIVKPDFGSSLYTVRFLPAIHFDSLSGTQVLSQASSLYVGFRSEYEYTSRTRKTSLDRYSPAGDASGTGVRISEYNNGSSLDAGVYLSNRISGNITVTMRVRVSTGKIR